MLAYALLNVAYQGSTPPAIVPKPASCHFSEGEFALDSSKTPIHYVGGGASEADLVSRSLKLLAKPARAKAASDGTITFVIDKNATTGDEGYKLTVTDKRIEAVAKTGAGLFYAGQTLRQLASAPHEVDSKHPNVGWIPCCEISDAPSYGWRGLLLDVSRHFRPKADIERYLDLMAFHKLNVFHWHLVDDGGWRIEIKKYPELTRRGAWRSTPKESWGGPIVFPEKHSDDEYGGFYTQADVKEILAYASARHITIVPEIEMPGHSLDAIACYPNLGCDKPDGSGTVLNSNYCPGKEETFKFLTGVLDEVVALFPSKFIHIGGDEVDKGTWKQCPKCQARIKSEGLKNEEELQSYLIKRIEKHLNSKGRRLIGWDEILEGGLAPNATVMSWRGIEGGIEAAKQGKNAVMCPTSHCYFDYPYANTPVSKVYSYNPIPDALSPEQAKLVLGGQGNLWTEWIPTRQRLDQMTWPRAAALAEVFWTPRSEQSWTDFESRLPAEYAWLTEMGVDFMPPSPKVPINVVVADGATKLDFGSSDNQFVKLRYTTDGTEPSTASPEFTGPVEVTSNKVLKAAYFTAGGGHGDTSKVTVCIGKAQAPAGDLKPGLNVSYYEGEWESLPNLAKLTSLSTTTTTEISLAPKKRDENYGLRFSGFIDIPTDGTYTFVMTSDDGALLKIDGADVIDDGQSHAPRAKAGTIQLPKGCYPLELSYYQIGGAQRLQLEVSGPGIRLQVVPTEWLKH